MQAQLTFNLPEDQIEFDLAANGGKWAHVAWQMDQWLRTQTKYASDTISDDTYLAYEEARDKLKELLNEGGLIFQ
jgi:hypothetical protein